METVDALRPLSLDQFAAMTAEMETGFPRDRVLESASVSVEQWELTQETWLLRMAKQGSQRKLALLDRYNELLAKHRKAAQRKMRAEKRRLKGPMPVPAEAHLSPLARVRADDGAAGATFQKGTPGGDGADRASIAVAPAWTAGPAVPPIVQGVPAAPAILTPPPAVATAPPPAIAPAIATAPPPADTLDEDDYAEGFNGIAPGPEALVAATGPAWLATGPRPPSERTSGPPREVPVGPFAPTGPAWLSGPRAATPPQPQAPVPPATPAPSAASRAPAPPAKPPADPLASTLPPGVTSPLAAGPAWMKSSAGRAAVPGPQGASPPAGGPSRAPRGGTLSEASAGGPFGPAWLAPGALARGDGGPRTPEVGLPFQQRTDAPAAGAPPPPATAPPVPDQKPAPAQAGPRLSIEQLAWLQAQMEAAPELGRAAREKLSLSEAEYTAERAFWQARFQQDRAMVERYSQLFYHYRRAR